MVTAGTREGAVPRTAVLANGHKSPPFIVILISVGFRNLLDSLGFASAVAVAEFTLGDLRCPVVVETSAATL